MRGRRAGTDGFLSSTAPLSMQRATNVDEIWFSEKQSVKVADTLTCLKEQL